MNQVMVNILRSPLHPILSKDIMVIRFAGRKSGDFFSTQVSYLRRGSEVTVLTRSQWWKNVAGGRPVWLTIKGKEYTGVADACSDDIPLIAGTMRQFLKEKPANARSFGLAARPGEAIDPAEFERVVQQKKVVIVTIRLDIQD
jgi:hypothetical protein